MSTSLNYIAASVALMLLDGCASLQRPPPPSLEQIVQLAQAGTPAEDIIRELQNTRAVYPLTASQIVKLHEQGVPDTVLDYMHNAYADNIRWNARMQYEGAYGWNNCFYCYRPPVVMLPR